MKNLVLSRTPFVAWVLVGTLVTGCGQSILEAELAKSDPTDNAVDKPMEKDAGLTVQTVQADKVSTPTVNPNAFQFPSSAEIANQPNAETILYGKKLIEHTHIELPNNVTAKINCTNCHLNAGTVPNAMPFVGVDDRYPKYRARSGKEDNLAERINGCFQRSMNGIVLSEDAPEMVAMIAYMEWLSSEVEDGKLVEEAGLSKLEPLTPDVDNGKLLYQAKCQMCHQADGAGLATPDGTRLYPPLWGGDSYNVGAGMARLHTAAAFIKWNMPFGQGGSLSDQEAYDIAAYFSTQERPDFAHKNTDWPKGGKPDDARY